MAKKNKKLSLRKLTTTQVVLGIACLVLIVLGFEVARLKTEVNKLDTYQLAGLITRAIDNLTQPLPQDPVTGKGYIVEAKLQFPAPSKDLGKVGYNYVPNEPGFSGYLSLVSFRDTAPYKNKFLSGALNTEQIFAMNTKYQACARGVNISFDEQKHLGQPAGNKTLTNGQTVYFYTEAECPNAELLSFAQSINSY